VAKKTRRPRRQETPRSRLAVARLKRSVTQQQLADVTGLSLTTIRRLDRGEIEHPPITFLLNCARALEVNITELIEPEWQWSVFDASKAADPPAKEWWQREKKRRPLPGPGRINRRRLAGLED
jgi:transcriptional regulator with XRE-family HTH domain